MAIVRIPDEGRTLNSAEGRLCLAGVGITHERWEAAQPLHDDSSSADVLSAYAAEVLRLKAEGGYVTADVIDVKPDTPNLEAMLARFRSEHWHDEDEVRFIVAGHGVFHIHPPGQRILSVEVGPGDLLRVPRGTWHWFDLCSDRRIRAIRLFQDPAGWTPHYTSSGAETLHAPLCLGPQDLRGEGA